MPDIPTTPSRIASVSLPTTVDNETKGKRKFVETKPQPSSPTILRFKIRDFSGLAHPKGSFVKTRSIRIDDRLWHLRVYPRGHGRSRSDKVLVSCFLAVSDNDNDGEAEDELPSPLFASSTKSSPEKYIDFCFRIQNWIMTPKRCAFRSNMAYGFMGHTREKILEHGIDKNGNLVVNVAVKLWSHIPPQTTTIEDNTIFYPNKKQKHQKISDCRYDIAGKLYRSPKFTDIAFAVGGTVVYAHKCVLAVRAMPLLELALQEENDGNDESCNKNGPIRLPNVDENVFLAFVDYVYTSNEHRLLKFLGTEGDLGPARSLLILADKYGATDLKIFLESVLADKFLTITNCCEIILMADSHWCALLKEEAMKLFLSDPMASVRGCKEGWISLKKSPRLLSELLSLSAKIKTANNHKLNHHQRPIEDLVSVSALRKWLEQAGLGLDGSKEILVRRCRDHYRRIRVQPC